MYEEKQDLPNVECWDELDFDYYSFTQNQESISHTFSHR